MVAGVAVPSLRDFNNTQSVDNAASQLMNVLNRAQSSARNRIQCPINDEVATKWQVNLNLSGTSDTYSLVTFCESTPTTAQTVLTSPFVANSNSATQLRAETEISPDGCGTSSGQGVNLSIFFANQQFSYQCNGDVVQTTRRLKIKVLDASNKSKTVVIEPGGVIRSE